MKILVFIVIIIFLYLLAIMPRMMNKPSMQPFMDRYYAHRGLHKEKSIAPENSLAAFQLAVDHNYGIELDVQLSKDNIPVVFHDFTLNRLCGVDKKVRDLTFEELRMLTLHDSEEKIPLFQEVLDLVNGSVPLIIEYKLPGNNPLVCEIGDKILRDYKGVYCIESFNPLALRWYKKNHPEVVRGQLSTKFIRNKDGSKSKVLDFALQNLLLNFLGKPDFIAFNYKWKDMLSFSLVRSLYKVPTVAYTLTSNQQIIDGKHKFDLFIFEKFIPE